MAFPHSPHSYQCKYVHLRPFSPCHLATELFFFESATRFSAWHYKILHISGWLGRGPIFFYFFVITKPRVEWGERGFALMEIFWKACQDSCIDLVSKQQSFCPLQVANSITSQQKRILVTASAQQKEDILQYNNSVCMVEGEQMLSWLPAELIKKGRLRSLG